jgi:hypothetical protein
MEQSFQYLSGSTGERRLTALLCWMVPGDP